jgi:hypothetical protein
MAVQIGRGAFKRVLAQNITVRLGVSISDQALPQPFNLNPSTGCRNHGFKELVKMFGDTR